MALLSDDHVYDHAHTDRVPLCITVTARLRLATNKVKSDITEILDAIVSPAALMQSPHRSRNTNNGRRREHRVLIHSSTHNRLKEAML